MKTNSKLIYEWKPTPSTISIGDGKFHLDNLIRSLVTNPPPAEEIYNCFTNLRKQCIMWFKTTNLLSLQVPQASVM